ncbi:MAG: helix-turn-helix domain-containing protein, partial [Acidimicrobiales bacterium]
MRHRRADGRGAGDGDGGPPPPSPADIGRVLRERREERGLDLLTVHDRLGRPITQLEALEAGDLSRLTNQAFALSTLRRYARFLALDGDALARQFMESISAVGPGPSRGGGPAVAPTAMVTAVDSGPDHLRAFTQTGPVPRVGGFNNGFAGPGFSGSGPPTGTLSVIPREQIKETRKIQRKVRRSRRAPASLRLATWLVLVLLLVALAGVGLRHYQPQLLVQWHIAQPNGAL